jgi:hypothetical protein
MKFLKKRLNPQILVLMFLSSIFLISCSDNLSREKAEALIKARTGLPFNEVKSFKLYYENGFGIHEIKFLEDDGLISIRLKPGWASSDYIVELTENGKKFLDNDSPIGDDLKSIPVVTSFVSFGEITGIIERKELNEAEVNFTIVRSKITPFGIANKLNEGPENLKIIMAKYDNGWRIKE